MLEQRTSLRPWLVQCPLTQHGAFVGSDEDALFGASRRHNKRQVVLEGIKVKSFAYDFMPSFVFVFLLGGAQAVLRTLFQILVIVVLVLLVLLAIFVVLLIFNLLVIFGVFGVFGVFVVLGV